MTLVIFISVSFIFFIWGLVFILRGLQKKELQTSIVPITDINEIKPKDARFSDNLFETQAIKQSRADGANATMEELKTENILLSEALKRELSIKKIDEQQEESTFTELEQQYQTSQKALDEISAENLKLKKTIEELKSRVSDREELITKLKNEADKNLNDFKQSSYDKHELNNLTNKLNEEIVVLKSRISDKEEIISRLREEAQRQENDFTLKNCVLEKKTNETIEEKNELNFLANKLREEISEKNAKIKGYVKEISELKKQYENNEKIYFQKMIEAAELIEKFDIKIKTLNKNDIDPGSIEIADKVSLVNDLAKQNEQLIKEKNELEQKIKKIEEFNNHLFKKEKILQYELTKNRAQIIGLEKICEDFKVKIEQQSN